MKFATILVFLYMTYNLANSQVIIKKANQKMFLLEINNSTFDTLFFFNPNASFNFIGKLNKHIINSKRIEHLDSTLAIYMNDTIINDNIYDRVDMYDSIRIKLGIWKYLPLLPLQKIEIKVSFPDKIKYENILLFYSINNFRVECRSKATQRRKNHPR
jgi:hypothetical protein